VIAPSVRLYRPAHSPARRLAWLVIWLSVSGLIGSCGGPRPEPTAPADPVVVQPVEAYRAPIQATVSSGDTIESVCRRLAGDDWVVWRDVLSAEIDSRKLFPGTVFDGIRSPGGDLVELRVILDQRSELIFEATSEGIATSRLDREVTSEVVRLEGVVETSLFQAVSAAGGRPALAVEIADIFRWDVDFLRDLRQGDSFVAIVDVQTIDGEFYRYGTVFAARFVNKGRTMNAVIFPDQDGRLGYYDLAGAPLRKMFLRSPLKFSRITSRFSNSRFHPVLKKSMPHYGVDYGAPVGTPVHATADGVVTLAGRNGGGGNTVRLRHPNGYETNYLHLSRYGKGVRTGARVTQGQVIGYVGATGLASGPHLDYRVKLNGKWINPMTISSPPVKPLEGDRLQRFLGHALAVLDLLDGGEAPAGARG
jgi:murein DD-endopeptidase MepM/ murein hydrolase activator NlpD